MTWTAAEGRWTVVVMNADGSRPVAAELTAGVTAPVMRGLWIGLGVGGAVALLAGALLVALAFRTDRRTARPCPPEGGPDEWHCGCVPSAGGVRVEGTALTVSSSRRLGQPRR